MRIITINGKKRKLPNNYRQLIAEQTNISKSTVSAVKDGYRIDYYNIKGQMLQLADEFEKKLKDQKKIKTV